MILNMILITSDVAKVRGVTKIIDKVYVMSLDISPLIKINLYLKDFGIGMHKTYAS